MKKPLIGISCNTEEENTVHSGIRVKHYLYNSYIKAIEESGGIPLIIPNGLNEEDLKQLSETLDGFLFSGGSDVNPLYYMEEDDGLSLEIDKRRDETELKLLDLVLNHTDKPVFGICRGMQVINVAMGGTLISDLEHYGKNRHSFIESSRSAFTHEICVKEGSRLKSILQDETRVNSFHHQAVDRLAESLVPTAYSKDDQVLEAAETTGDRYILLVQWHPEELIANKAHKRLFEEFVRQCNTTMN